nr:hypothetical protein FFPRI1PSEUD_24480 [Pseudomonas sp. FFPRI_1]
MCNCQLSIQFSLGQGLSISACNTGFSIEDQLTAVSARNGFLENFDYLYGYRETQAY